MKINIRKDRMTKDERWLALLNRKPLDRIPVFGFAAAFSTVHCNLTVADAYNPGHEKFLVKLVHVKLVFQQAVQPGHLLLQLVCECRSQEINQRRQSESGDHQPEWRGLHGVQGHRRRTVEVMTYRRHHVILRQDSDGILQPPNSTGPMVR